MPKAPQKNSKSGGVSRMLSHKGRSVAIVAACLALSVAVVVVVADFGRILSSGAVRGSVSGDDGGGGMIEICNDGITNDGDILVDCEDTDDCPNTISCYIDPGDEDAGIPATFFECKDGECCPLNENSFVSLFPTIPDACHDCDDTDCDGLIDSEDPDCGGIPMPSSEVLCEDYLDNDCDGFEDGDDLDCGGLGNELCTDELDNDADSLVDCADSYCEGQSCGLLFRCNGGICCAQHEFFNLCNNGSDDDCDFMTDCDDSDCASAPNCTFSTTGTAGGGTVGTTGGSCTSSETGLCGNAIDDDCDGMVDFADTECMGDTTTTMTTATTGAAEVAPFPVTAPTEETTASEMENSQNLFEAFTSFISSFFGGESSTHESAPADDAQDDEEVPIGEICYDTIDNDDDGFIDCTDADCPDGESCQFALGGTCMLGLCCSDEEWNCSNGIDDDCDTKIDFDDNDCYGSAAGGSGGEGDIAGLIGGDASIFMPETPCTSQALCEAPDVGGTWNTADPGCGCQYAELSLEISGPSSVTENSTVTFAVIVQNTGRSTAKNVVLVDVYPLSQGLAYLPESSSTVCRGGVCSLGDIPSGGSQTVLLSFSLPPGQCDSVNNVVTADAQNSALAESATVVTTVVCGAAATTLAPATSPAPAAATTGGTGGFCGVGGFCGPGGCPTGYTCQNNVFLCFCRPVPTYCCQSFTPPAPASVCINYTSAGSCTGSTYTNDPTCGGACPPPTCAPGSTCTASQAACTALNPGATWAQTGCAIPPNAPVATNGCCSSTAVACPAGISCQSTTSCTPSTTFPGKHCTQYNCNGSFPNTCCCELGPIAPPPDPCTVGGGIPCGFDATCSPNANCPKCNQITHRCYKP